MYISKKDAYAVNRLFETYGKEPLINYIHLICESKDAEYFTQAIRSRMQALYERSKEVKSSLRANDRGLFTVSNTICDLMQEVNDIFEFMTIEINDTAYENEYAINVDREIDLMTYFFALLNLLYGNSDMESSKYPEIEEEIERLYTNILYSPFYSEEDPEILNLDNPANKLPLVSFVFSVENLSRLIIKYIDLFMHN